MLSEDEVRRRLQRLLVPGIVLVVGSGLSCAEGLPGMGGLADFLEQAEPEAPQSEAETPSWQEVISAVRQYGLEEGLHRVQASSSLIAFIRARIAKCILDHESRVIANVLTNRTHLRLSKLLPYLPQNGRISVVTTNYDRLIEIAAEKSGFKVDTCSFGMYHAPISRANSAYTFCDKVEVSGKSLHLIERKVISLYKPHGSLDWFLCDNLPIRSGYPLPLEHCLIIPPGGDKYRAGYERQFDLHRTLANHAIQNANAFLIVGYGFNDDHLETYLNARIAAGVPTAILTRSLSDNAKLLLERHAHIIAVEAAKDCDRSSVVYFGSQRIRLDSDPIWDLGGFARGVFGL